MRLKVSVLIVSLSAIASCKSAGKKDSSGVKSQNDSGSSIIEKLTDNEIKAAIGLFTKGKVKGIDQGGGDCFISEASLSSTVNGLSMSPAVFTITPKVGTRWKPESGEQIRLSNQTDQTEIIAINGLFDNHLVGSVQMGGPGGDVSSQSATVKSSNCGLGAASWTISFSKKAPPVNIENFPVGQPGGCFPSLSKQSSNNGASLADEQSGNYPVGQEGGCMLGTALRNNDWAGVRNVNPSQYLYAILRCYNPNFMDAVTGRALEVLDIVSSRDHTRSAMVYMPPGYQTTPPMPATFTIGPMNDYSTGQSVGQGAQYMTEDRTLMLAYPLYQGDERRYTASFYNSNDPYRHTLLCEPQDGSGAGSQNSGVIPQVGLPARPIENQNSGGIPPGAQGYPGNMPRNN